MTRLDNDWLLQALLTCHPGIPTPYVSTPIPPGLSHSEEDLFHSYFGHGDRFRRAENIYLAMKRRSRDLVCHIDLEPIWSTLINTEHQAHSRLDRLISGKMYRDHIFHPAAVAMLIWELLNRFPRVLARDAAQILEDRHGHHYSLDPLQNQTWPVVLQQAALLSGFLHDHCCMYEEMMLASRGADIVHLFEPPDILASPRDTIGALTSFGLVEEAVRDEVLAKLTLGSHWHAPISAISLMTYMAKANNDFERAVIHLAADAVLWHHDLCQRDNFLFEAHPLRYLLALCDGLHEFCRELLQRDEETGSDGRFVESFRASCTHAILSTNRRYKRLRINYHVACGDGICETRWMLRPFRDGLRRLGRFVTPCGPILIESDVTHESCRHCRHHPARHP